MNINNITALKPHTSYKKKVKIPSYSLFSNIKNFSDKHYPNSLKLTRVMSPIISTSEIHTLAPIIETNIKWETTSPLITPENNPEPIGFIIIRNVISTKTNEYWKECYRCIKKFYPRNRILIIDEIRYRYFSNNYI